MTWCFSGCDQNSAWLGPDVTGAPWPKCRGISWPAPCSAWPAAAAAPAPGTARCAVRRWSWPPWKTRPNDGEWCKQWPVAGESQKGRWMWWEYDRTKAKISKTVFFKSHVGQKHIFLCSLPKVKRSHLVFWLLFLVKWNWQSLIMHHGERYDLHPCFKGKSLAVWPTWKITTVFHIVSYLLSFRPSIFPFVLILDILVQSIFIHFPWKKQSKTGGNPSMSSWSDSLVPCEHKSAAKECSHGFSDYSTPTIMKEIWKSTKTNAWNCHVIHRGIHVLNLRRISINWQILPMLRVVSTTSKPENLYLIKHHMTYNQAVHMFPPPPTDSNHQITPKISKKSNNHKSTFT